MIKVSCRTLGPVEVMLGDDPAPPELLWRKNLALLVYLARSPARRRSRDHLIGLLWGDKEESAARHSLREAIRVLRKYLGEERLTVASDHVGLDPGVVELDVDALERLSELRDWSGAAQLVSGEFLEGFTVPDASPFEDWLLSERSFWKQRAINVLLHCAESRLAAADIQGAEQIARRALQFDPSSDRALRTALKCLALAGDSPAAISLYDSFNLDATRRGTGPDAETRSLADRIRQGRSWRLPEYARPRERSADARRPPLIGREGHLAAVLNRLDRIRQHGLAIVLVEADAGLGKTRLIEEVLARAGLDGVACSSMRAVPADGEESLSGLTGLAAGGLIDARGVAGAPRSSLAAIAAHLPDWSERFPGLAAGTTPTTFLHAVTDVLRVVSAEQAVVLSIDDAHFLDDESWGGIEQMARDLARAPVLVLVSAAHEPSGPRLLQFKSRIGRDIPGEVLRLESFEADDLRALARGMFTGYSEEQVDRVARRVAVESAGVPLLAVEILRAILLGLDLTQQPGERAVWPEPLRTLDHTLPGDLPDTVVAAIRVNFRRLTRPAQLVLSAAAILRQRVNAATLGRVTGLSGDDLHSALDELEWQRWLTADPRGYTFVARIVSDVVSRDMVTEGQRGRVLAAAN